MKTICICGGGSLGHVIAGWLSSRECAVVNVLTSHPDDWNHSISVVIPEGRTLIGTVSKISSSPSEVIPDSDIVLLAVPGFLISGELIKIKPYLKSDTYVGSVFSSTGFFFEARKILPMQQPLWGFQRVPFICRVAVYGHSANLLGYKPFHNIAVENVPYDAKTSFVGLISDWFDRPVSLLKNYLEASLTNSNPLLHTSRLYSMFAEENEGKVFSRMILFYEEWTEKAADLLIEMDREFFTLLKTLPVSDGFLPTILEYYESDDARTLTEKLSSIKGFKGITSPMVQTEDGFWVPDFSSRYFTEDFSFGLKYIHDLAVEKGILIPTIDKVYKWGISKVSACH